MPDFRPKWFDDYYSDLNRLVPSQNRSQNWRALGESLGVPLPPLDDSGGLDSPPIPQNVSSILYLSSWIMENHPDRFVWKKPATFAPMPVIYM